MGEDDIPCLGLKRSFPNVLDLSKASVEAPAEGGRGRSYLNEMPYCDTASKPLFQTRVTSQALVADRRQERKAETALPPTAHTFWVSGSSAMVGCVVEEVACNVRKATA